MRRTYSYNWILCNHILHKAMLKFLGDRFSIQESHVQNHWVAPRSTQPFILLRLIKWVPGNSGEVVVKNKLPHQSGSLALKQLNPIHKKGLYIILKKFKKTHKKYFDIRKTKNIGICHDRYLAIFHHTICLIALEIMSRSDINSKLNPLTKFTSSKGSIDFKDIQSFPFDVRSSTYQGSNYLFTSDPRKFSD